MGVVFIDSVEPLGGSLVTYGRYDAGGGSVTISNTQIRRASTQAYVFNNAASAPYLEKNISGTPNSVGFGLAIELADATYTSHAGFEIYRSGSVQASVRINDARTISVFRGTPGGGTLLTTSTYALTIGVWYYFEFGITVDDAAGAYDVRINGQTVTSGSSVDTKDTGTAGVDAIRFNGCATATDSDINVQDIYIKDDSTLLGDMRVDYIRPNGAGNYSQFDPSSGTNYQMIDDSSPDDDAGYNSTAVANEIDSFAYGNLSALSTTISAVAVNTVMRKTDVDARGISALARISSTDYTGTEHNLNDAYTIHQHIWETSPATASAWSEAEINGAEFGYKLTT